MARKDKKQRIAYGHKKPRGQSITRKRLLAAIPGSYGRITRIAAKLDVNTHSVHNAIIRNGWDDIKAKIHEEREKVALIAEDRAMSLLKQKVDLKVAAKMACYILDKRGKALGYGPTQKEIALSGGDNPIRVKDETEGPRPVKIDIKTLPLEARIALLAQLNSTSEEAGEDETPKARIKVRKIRKK